MKTPFLPRFTSVSWPSTKKRRASIDSTPIPLEDVADELPEHFSTTLSALDLATTPLALERARARARVKSYDPIPLVSLVPEYTPLPRFLNFRRLRAYETRKLIPFIRIAVRSQPILIRHNGSLSPCRIEPLDPSEPGVPTYIIFDKISRRINGVYNAHRSLDGLDLQVRDELKKKLLSIRDKRAPFYSFKHITSAFHANRGFTNSWLEIRIIFLNILLITSVLVVGLASLGASFLFYWCSFNQLPFSFGFLDQYFCGNLPIPMKSESPIMAPNPDVAGIGGRLAFYMQTFILTILLSLSSEGEKASSWALVFTSLSFVLSTLISASTSQLSLYHSILAVKMQQIPMTVLTIVEVFPPVRNRGPYLVLLQFFRFILVSVIKIWQSVTAPCFGNQPQSNIFVVDHSWFSPAQQAFTLDDRTSSFILAICILYARLIHALFFPEIYTLTLKSIFSDHARQKWDKLTAERPVTRPDSPDDWFELLFIDSLLSFLRDNSKPPFVKLKRRPTALVSQAVNSIPHPVTTPTTKSSASIRLQILYQTAILNAKIALRYPKFWRLIIALFVGSLQVYDIEATISLNKPIVGPGENVWTYGQVLAAILTMIPVVQLLQFLGIAPV